MTIAKNETTPQDTAPGVPNMQLGLAELLCDPAFVAEYAPHPDELMRLCRLSYSLPWSASKEFYLQALQDIRRETVTGEPAASKEFYKSALMDRRKVESN